MAGDVQMPIPTVARRGLFHTMRSVAARTIANAGPPRNAVPTPGSPWI